MSAKPIIRHVHLHGIVPFKHVSSLQSTLVAHNLNHKATTSSLPLPHRPPQAPKPTIITFTPTPVYTFGRRDPPESLNPRFLKTLREPLDLLTAEESWASPLVAETIPTLRGGQTTFHGPGQLVIYPILDLKSEFIKKNSSKFPQGLNVRCYVNLLEEATIRLLYRLKIYGNRTENPGVWASVKSYDNLKELSIEEKKIAALGVHLRRNVTSYGVALNVFTDLRWFNRIVACGLEGKGTTSIREASASVGGRWMRQGRERKQVLIDTLAMEWVDIFAGLLLGQEGEKSRVGMSVGDLHLGFEGDEKTFWDDYMKQKKLKANFEDDAVFEDEATLEDDSTPPGRH